MTDYVVTVESRVISANSPAKLCLRRYSAEDCVYTVVANGSFDEIKPLADELNKEHNK